MRYRLAAMTRSQPSATPAGLRTAALAAVLAAAIVGRPATASAATYPDWESQWRNADTAQKGDPWDPTKPSGLGQQAPLTPEYQAILEESLAAQAAGGNGNDRSSSCALPGMPRMMSLIAPMEILISPGVTYMMFQNTPPRRIYTDGRDWPDEAATYAGNSLGHWIDEDGDGRYDALEIETRNFTGPRALESTGLPLHKDDETVVKERLYLDKANSNILHDAITTIDHAFTRPWTVLKSYARQRHPGWAEYNCEVTNTHVEIGGQEYAIGPDGKLMPLRKGQPAPSLKYFK
jgi:hypothetical protein